MINIKAIFLALSLLYLLMPVNSYACSCGAKPSVKEAFNAVDIVFIGKVIAVQKEDWFNKNTLQVKESFKDSDNYLLNKTEVEIWSKRPWGAGCSGGMPKGYSFIVYAKKNERTNHMIAHWCGRTKLIPEEHLQMIKGIQLKSDDLIIFTGAVADKKLIKIDKRGKHRLITFKIDEILRQALTPLQAGEVLEIRAVDCAHSFDKGERFLIEAFEGKDRTGKPGYYQYTKTYTLRCYATTSLDEVKKLRNLSILERKGKQNGN